LGMLYPALDSFHIQTIFTLVSLTLGYVVWTYNSKSYLNKILTVLIICVVLIELSMLFNIKIKGGRFLFATIVLGSLGISFFTPFFYTLSLYYPIKKRFSVKYLVAVYSISLVLSALIIMSFPKGYMVDKLLFPWNFRDVSMKNFPHTFVLLYFLLTSFSIFLLILSTRNFLSSFKENIIPYEKHTVRMLILIGAPLAYLLSTVSVINYFFNIPFPWIGFFLALFTLFIVILIFRFHLIDLKRFIGGVLLFPALIAVVVFIYIYFILQNQNTIAQVLALPSNVALVLEVFIIYLVVSTLKRLLDISSRKRKFHSISALSSGSLEPLENLSYALSLKELYSRLKSVLGMYCKKEKIMVLILDREQKSFLDVDEHASFSLPVSSELVKVLSSINRGAALEELIIYMNNHGDIQTLFNMEINLVVPIKQGKEVIALVFLPKRSLIRRWSYDDIRSLNYLKTIMPSLIDRCTMYENEKEIEKHEFRMEQFMVMGQMASGLAHEIRNPLSIISTSVETIINAGIGKKDRLKMLHYIQEETNRINLLVNKLLSINFQKHPEYEEIELVSIFHRLKNFLEYKIKSKNVSFSVNDVEEYPLYSDPNLLFQIFLNLCLNSIEAFKEGGRIDVDFYRENNSVVVVFDDDGPGIPTRVKNKIFEPFFTTKEKGTGLGLTVTRQLVESLYGSIELVPVKSGVRFRIVLPRLKAM
jgi:signal transduction histidine kinase